MNVHNIFFAVLLAALAVVPMSAAQAQTQPQKAPDKKWVSEIPMANGVPITRTPKAETLEQKKENFDKKTEIIAKLKKEGVYRGFVWGVSMEDVKHYEQATFYKQEGDSLYFLVKPDAFRRIIRYDFENNRLVRIHVEYVEYTDPNSQVILNNFYNEDVAMRTKFGDPAKEEFFWKDKKYLNYPQFWGRALYSRDLRIRNEWVVDDTRAVLETYYDKIYYQITATFEKIRTTPDPATSILNLQSGSPQP